LKVTILGGGFSGTALSSELIRKTPGELSLTLIEQSNHLAQGTAFSTSCPKHLLNVSAINMGALADSPDNFYQWLMYNEDEWRALDPTYQSLPFGPNHFMPRKIYGHYLKILLEKTQKLAKERGHRFEIINDQAQDITRDVEGKLAVAFSSRELLQTDKLVLACGIKTTKELTNLPITDECIHDIWGCDPKQIEEQISLSTDNSVTVIIGTGLTMVDMVTTLIDLKYRGKIVALSRHGFLPRVHCCAASSYIDFEQEMIFATTLPKKIACFIKKIDEYGIDRVPDLIDSLRPYTIKLWQQLSTREHKSFMRHLFSKWNIYRHRIPPESNFLLQKLISENRLTIVTGTFLAAKKTPAGYIEIDYHFHNEATVHQMQADFLYNCTGPDYKLNHSPHPLIHRLLHKGWISKDALGLGISCTNNLQCKGPLRESLFAMGALLFGERFETTSVPYIRTHAQIICNAITTENHR